MSEHDMEVDDESPRCQKARSLEKLINGSFSSSLSRLSSSSRAIPFDKDFHFYHNFEEFSQPIREIADKSQSVLETVGSSAEMLGKPVSFPREIDGDEAYDWLVNVNDEIFERFGVSMDEFEKVRKKEEETGRPLASGHDENGFQTVYGKKKKNATEIKSRSDSVKESPSGVKVAARDKKASGTGKAKIPFHIPTIRRPQDEYRMLVNNANRPFEHVWLSRSEDGQRVIHPLENSSVLDFVDKDIGVGEPLKPPPMEETPFKLVEDVKALKELAAKLHAADEFAVDLEHNQYRSFQGLTCLMQISTRTEDFIVDTLKLRIHVGPYLREVFKDPKKKKVMHGADKDILWLQRDFGIYVCNLFDTGQASRVLRLERNSLEFLLQYFCGITANKEYQNADWRLRPLPDEMVRYAREDTHYLLHVYDVMKIKLQSMPKDPEHSDEPLLEVYKRSYDVCRQLYEKDLLTENSYLHIYGLQAADLNAHQLAIVAGLCEWRDAVARAEDESTGYILPNKTLIEIAKQMPVSASKLRRLLRSKHPYVEQNIGAVVSVIKRSLQNAAAFEAIAQQLKEGHTAAVSQDKQEEDMVLEAAAPENLVEDANAGKEDIDIHITEDAGVHASSSASLHVIEESLKVGSDLTRCGIVKDGAPTELQGANTKETTGGDVSSGKVFAAVQVSKKPVGGFGALLGKAASKRKFGNDEKRKDEMKLEQIRTSVNLPFHSFSGNPKPAVDEPLKVPEPQKPSAPSSAPPLSSKPDDIILLDASSEDEPEKTDSVAVKSPPETKSESSRGEAVETTLSELSTSFQKCFDSINQKKNAKPETSKRPSGFMNLKPGFLNIKPFDYEAARKEVKIGEPDDGDQKRLVGSDGKKKGPAASGRKTEGMSEFGQGKRRQAFPASGNRSATFL